MDFISDNFISYGDTFTVKQEKLSEHDPSKASLLSYDSESTSPCAGSVPLTLQNFLNSSDPTTEAVHTFQKQVGPKKHKPFRIIKAKPGEPAETINLKIEADEKVLNRTKRILKRVKAKQRIQLKQEYVASGSPTSSKYTQDAINDLNLDDKSKKKMLQMIRNRISAQNSRDRKKHYMCNLEDSKNRLADDNLKLRNSHTELLKEVKRLKEVQAQLVDQNELIKKSFGLISNSSNEDFSKIFGGNEGNILSSKTFGKDFDELSSMVLSKFPNCDKALFNNVFTLSTYISMNIMSNLSQRGIPSSEGLDNFEEVGKLMSKMFGGLASSEHKENDNSSLLACLNDFSLKSDHNTRYKDFLESHLQAERALSQSSDIIKIEESEAGNGVGFYQNPTEAGFIGKSNVLPSGQEEQSFDLFSPRNFKVLDQRITKSKTPKSIFEGIENFQEPSVFTDFVDMNEISKPQQDLKDSNDNGLVGLLFKALIHPDLLQNTTR